MTFFETTKKKAKNIKKYRKKDDNKERFQ